MSINVELQERGKGVEKQASKSQKKLPDNYSKLRGADLYAGNFLYLITSTYATFKAQSICCHREQQVKAKQVRNGCHREDR